MPERQLHLFQPSRPLALRLGDEFFRAAPREPGVYLMTGADGRLLYIGQSRNLRARLGSYKNARRDRTPRKVLRLVHEVRNITWEKCDSPEAAISRESELLRVHRPKFNRANVWPTYSYFWLSTENEALTIGRTKCQNGDPQAPALQCEIQHGETKLYGPFKGSAVSVHSALLRLIWTVTHHVTNLSDFPSGLLSDKPPRVFTIRWPGSPQKELVLHLADFLSGNSNSLIALLQESLPCDQILSPFQRALHTRDLEILEQFYLTTVRRGAPCRADAPCGSPNEAA